MYNIAVCDDEAAFLRQVSDMTEEILSAHGIDCRITRLSCAEELNEQLSKSSNAFDILLLDIIFKDVNGVRLAEYLRSEGNDVPVIFITSSSDFLLDAYSAEPVGYVMKPVEREKLEQALLRAVRRKRLDTMVVESPSMTVSVRLTEVVFFEVFNKTLLLHMRDGAVTEISKTLSAVGENLPPDRFVQCHRCYIVALSSILSIRRYEITLKNHTKIPISKKYYATVQERLQQYAARWF